MLQWHFSQRKNIKANFIKFFVIKMISSIKNKSRLCHCLKDSFKIQFAIFLPLCDKGQYVCTISSFIYVFYKTNITLYFLQILTGIFQSFGSWTLTHAYSASNFSQSGIAGESRVSPVSCLKAKPSNVMVLPANVLNCS